jgi:hypothetical protein
VRNSSSSGPTSFPFIVVQTHCSGASRKLKARPGKQKRR